MLKRASGVTAWDALSAISKPLIASLIMGAGVWGLMELIRPYFTHVLIAVLICVAVGMLLYAIVLFSISSEARKLARSQLRNFRARLAKK